MDTSSHYRLYYTIIPIHQFIYWILVNPADQMRMLCMNVPLRGDLFAR